MKTYIIRAKCANNWETRLMVAKCENESDAMLKAAKVLSLMNELNMLPYPIYQITVVEENV